MHYIRFLKPPKLVKTGQSEYSVKIVLTITTDLGDDFFSNDVSLLILVRSETNFYNVLARQHAAWTSGIRALLVSIPLGPSYDSRAFFVDVHCNEDSLEEPRESSGSIVMPCIIPVRSTLVQPNKGILEAEKLALRAIKLSNGHQLCISEDTGDSVARHVWDAGVALMFCLDRRAILHEFMTIKSKDSLNIVELGTGCGLVGLALAAIKPNWNVLLTDIPGAGPFIQRHNIHPGVSNVSYRDLDWACPVPQEISALHVDLIIAADCTYNPDSSPHLVKTIDSVERSSPGARILIASKTRHSSEAIFFDLMKHTAGFLVEKQVNVLSPHNSEDLGLDEAEKINIYVFSRPNS